MSLTRTLIRAWGYLCITEHAASRWRLLVGRPDVVGGGRLARAGLLSRLSSLGGRRSTGKTVQDRSFEDLGRPPQESVSGSAAPTRCCIGRTSFQQMPGGCVTVKGGLCVAFQVQFVGESRALLSPKLRGGGIFHDAVIMTTQISRRIGAPLKGRSHHFSADLSYSHPPYRRWRAGANRQGAGSQGCCGPRFAPTRCTSAKK